MKKVYIVYETDEWHSYMNRSMMGVFSSKRGAVNCILKNHNISFRELLCGYEDIENAPRTYIEKESRKIIRKELKENGQTQCYSRNYEIVCCDMNTLIA